MLQKLSLQIKLIGSFLSIVLGVGLIGWIGISRLNQHIQTLGDNTLPSINGLWEINEGQTRIHSSERFLLNPNISESQRTERLNEIREAWQQIDEGFRSYEPTDKTEAEQKWYEEFLKEWNNWKQAHQNYLKTEAEYHQIGISNPWEKKLELLNKNSPNSTELLAIEKALEFRKNLENQSEIKRLIFQTSTQKLLKVLDENQRVGEITKQAAFNDVRNTSILMIIALIIGPIITIFIGRWLSRGITEPIYESVNLIASSSAQITTTVVEQEHILAQQAASVNQTTTTMDELGNSSRQATAQAESAAENASQVFQLSQDGTEIVQQTLLGISKLQQKVEEIATEITGLQEQIIQIGTITNLVTEIATQTNVLALNASVEAVRAGENGKGFAIVASAIRQLANESKRSTEKIDLLVKNIQKSMNSSMLKTEEGKQNAAQGIQLSRQTGASFDNVNQAINNIMLINRQIALNLKQQTNAVEQVVTTMNAINQGSQQTVLGISQTKNSIVQLNEVAKNLKKLTGA